MDKAIQLVKEPDSIGTRMSSERHLVSSFRRRCSFFCSHDIPGQTYQRLRQICVPECMFGAICATLIDPFLEKLTRVFYR